MNCFIKRTFYVVSHLTFQITQPHLKNVISGERLRRVPAESHKGGGDRDRKQNYVQHLKQITWNKLTHSTQVNTYFNLEVQWARVVPVPIRGHAGKLAAVLIC